jgi:hypothetical protein
MGEQNRIRAGARGGLDGAAKRLRTHVHRDRRTGPQLQDRHRDEWPELWSAIDSILQCLDVLYPPVPEPTKGLFDGSFVRLPHQGPQSP